MDDKVWRMEVSYVKMQPSIFRYVYLFPSQKGSTARLGGAGVVVCVCVCACVCVCFFGGGVSRMILCSQIIQSILIFGSRVLGCSWYLMQGGRCNTTLTHVAGGE